MTQPTLWTQEQLAQHWLLPAVTDQRNIGLRHFLGRDLQRIPPSNRWEQAPGLAA